MIAFLEGQLHSVASDHAILNVNGVGYEVFCSERLLSSLKAGTSCELVIDTQVREESITLYGFASTNERDVFRLLQTVQGVGPRVALAIISLMSATAIGLAIAAEDEKAFTAVSGVGPKVAMRIIQTLKSKIGKLAAFDSDGDGETDSQTGLMPQHAQDAISALVNLGYTRTQVEGVVARMLQSKSEQSTQELIRNGLRELATQ